MASKTRGCLLTYYMEKMIIKRVKRNWKKDSDQGHTASLWESGSDVYPSFLMSHLISHPSTSCDVRVGKAA